MNIDTLQTKAIKHLTSGKLDKALELCRKILKKDPENIFAIHIQGKHAYDQEKYNDAIHYLKIVLDANPENPDILLELGGTLRLAKKNNDAVSFLRKSLSLKRTQAVLLELGLALDGACMQDEAKKYLHEALQEKPNCVNSIRRLANIAKKENDIDLAISYYEKLIKFWPDSVHSYPDIIKAHLQNSNPGKALELCENCLKINPACTGALAYQYIALSELGSTRALNYLFDTEKYIQKIKVKCPIKSIDINEFNKQLSTHILNHTQKTRTPEQYTTEYGWQTQNGILFSQNKKLGAAMLKVITNAIVEYRSMLPEDSNHPVYKGIPTETIIKSWAVVLNTKGHQAPHIHPESWLSGCYYIEIPDDFDSQPDPEAGYIAFGQCEYGLNPINKQKAITIKPEEGTLCMFPSYYWHHTIPLQSNKKRICIAFDVVPTKGWGK